METMFCMFSLMFLSQFAGSLRRSADGEAIHSLGVECVHILEQMVAVWDLSELKAIIYTTNGSFNRLEINQERLC